MGCVGIILSWSETIFIISLKENVDFVKFFKTFFGSKILAFLTELQCQDTDIFGSNWL